MSVVLPAPFGPMHRVEFAGIDCQVDAVERGKAAIALVQPLGDEKRFSHGSAPASQQGRSS